MPKLVGWSRMLKGKPHLRQISIQVPHEGINTYTVPTGCRIVSHLTYMSVGLGLITQIVVDTSNQSLGDEPPMPDDWDYRFYLRDGHTPVGRRLARRKTQREPGEGH